MDPERMSGSGKRCSSRLTAKASEKKKHEEEEHEKWRKRPRSDFPSPAVMGPRDTVVDTNLRKVKIEDAYEVVKAEVEEGSVSNEDGQFESPAEREVSTGEDEHVGEVKEEVVVKYEVDVDIEEHEGPPVSLENEVDTHDPSCSPSEDHTNRHTALEIEVEVQKRSLETKQSDGGVGLEKQLEELERGSENTASREEDWEKVHKLIPQVLEVVSTKLSLKDILTCRLVCSNWKSSVDLFLADHVFREELKQPISEENSHFLMKTANSSAFFRTLLLPKRVLFLFPKVFPILDSSRNPKLHKEHFCNPTDVMRMRLVCRTWCETIDNYSEERYEGAGVYGTCQCHDYHWTFTAFHENPEDVTRFLEHFESTHAGTSRSPFIARQFLFEEPDSDDPDYDDDEPFDWNDVTILLQKYGQHIRRFQIKIGGSFDPTFNYFPMMAEWLQQMQNLTKLTISFEMPAAVDILDLEDETRSTESIPKLEHLQTLEMFYVPSRIVNEMVKQNNHVSEIKVNRRSLTSNFVLFETSFPNLEELNMSFFSLEELNKLRSGAVDWPLKILFLEYQNSCHSSNEIAVCSSSYELFQILDEKFSATLEELTIDWRGETKYSEDILQVPVADIQQKLPNLRNLTLTMPTPTNVDFLLSLKGSLEILQVQIGYRHCCSSSDCENQFHDEQDKIPEAAIDFVGFLTRMYNSNIWQVLPKLENLEVDFDVDDEYNYTREEWQLKKSDF